MLRAFGFNEYDVMLSTRPEKSVGTDAMWDAATKALERAIQRVGLKYGVDQGGGAFYGPKIDVKIKDTLGRFWQCSTIQADFNLPERFDLNYVDQAGGRTRPVMVHRALLGSLERFFGVLVEHHGGAFPLWLAPVQATILSVGERHIEAARRVARELSDAGFRVTCDDSPEKIGHKVRLHLFEEKTPFACVLGDKELESGGLAVRHRSEGDLGTLTVEAFQSLLDQRVRERR
jgi:threonyl-tRNA synthetase